MFGNKEAELARQAEEARKQQIEERRLAAAQQTTADLKQLCTALQGGVKNCSAAVESLKNAIAHIPGADHFDGRLMSVESQLKDLRSLISGLDTKATDDRDKSGIARAEIKAQIEAIISGNKQYEAALSEKNSQILRLSEESQGYYNEWVRVKGELEKSDGDLKRKCEEFEKAKEEITHLKADLKEVQDQLGNKESNHNVELTQLTDTHAKEIAELKQTYATRETEHREEFEKTLSDYKTSAQQQVDALTIQYGSVFPAEICDLFGYRLGDANEAKNMLMVIYAYLGLIKGSLRPNLFTKSFQVFDGVLFDALEGDNDELESCRDRVEPHLNEFARNNGCPICVEWPKTGSQFNADTCFAEGSSGVKVQRTLRAVIYTVDARGGKKCTTKGRVETL